MKHRAVRFMKMSGWLVAGIFVIGAVMPTPAQTPGPPPGAGPPLNPDPMRLERERQTSEARLRTAELGAAEDAEKQKLIRAAIANVKQDFTRIQVLRNDIARNLVARKPLDYNLITEQTAEIHKRAQRLNLYMSARAPEDKEQNSSTDPQSEEMVDALVKLCKLIDSFTENPTLKNAGTVEAKEIEKAKEDKARADRDLLAILKLSESLQKKSGSLKAPK
jgi:hypothetical protein